MTEEEMEGPISFWGYKEQESNLILPEHDDEYSMSEVSFSCTIRQISYNRIEALINWLNLIN
jgi:hypothetical protein